MLGFFLSQALVNPILALADTAKLVSARNDYSLRAPKPAPGENDEIRLLSDTFNQVLIQIQQHQTDLNRAQAVAHIGSWRSHLKNKEIHWSDATYRIFGIPQGTVMTHQAFLERVHPEDRETVNRAWQATLQGAPYDLTHRIIANGTVKWVHEQAELERDAQGVVVSGFGTVQDITARKRVEDALRESEEKYRGLFENSRDAIMTLEPPSWRFTSGNPAVVKLFGAKSEAEFIAHAPWELSPKCQPDGSASTGKAREMIETAVREGAHFFEWTHRRIDGTEFPTNVLLTRMTLDEKTVVQATIRDITARKRNEESLRKLSLQLSRVEEEERRRIARELHDSTGQKLAALNMTLGLLQEATTDPDGKREKMFTEGLAMIEQCAQEIRTLSYLLHPPLLDELGLAAAISNYVEGYSKRSGVQVTFNPPPDLERLSDEVEITLFRVVQESLGNIHRHAGATTARIRLTCDAERAMLEVSDQGRGIFPEIIRALEAGRGAAGVGIAGMRERLRLLGGRLEIESGAQGTTVRAIIPQREEPT
ncbi:MAG: PAS domain S-box protein [Verrucomicrobiota bacterium]